VGNWWEASHRGQGAREGGIKEGGDQTRGWTALWGCGGEGKEPGRMVKKRYVWSQRCWWRLTGPEKGALGGLFEGQCEYGLDTLADTAVNVCQ